MKMGSKTFWGETWNIFFVSYVEDTGGSRAHTKGAQRGNNSRDFLLASAMLMSHRKYLLNMEGLSLRPSFPLGWDD